MQQRQPHRVVPSTPNLVISRDGHPFATAGDHQDQPATTSAGNAGTGSVAVHIPTSGHAHEQGLDAAPNSNGGAGAGHLKSGRGLAGHYPPSSHAATTGAGHARIGSDGAGGGGAAAAAAPSLLPIGRPSPSRVAASSNLSSSVHLPLLAASDHDSAGATSALDDNDTHAYRIRTPHKSAASSLLSMFLPKAGPRTRLHPFLLLPAFICGMLLTWTGQQSDTARRIVTSTLVSKRSLLLHAKPDYDHPKTNLPLRCSLLTMLRSQAADQTIPSTLPDTCTSIPPPSTRVPTRARSPSSTRTKRASARCGTRSTT